MTKKIRVGINGFGRIGRVVARQIMQYHQDSIEIAAINDITDTPSLAHLLKYDSVHRTFPLPVSVVDGALKIGDKTVTVWAEKDPQKIQWKSVEADIVLECSGIFTSKAQAMFHMVGGAKKVIISAPSSDPDLTIAFGVNEQMYNPSEHNVISCASCTTNCLAPMAKVLLDKFGIVRGTMTTIHSYTNDQRVLDLPHKDKRRMRAAALSMIPTTTGAAKAVGLVLPALKGKVDGYAIRVPTPDVSIVDFVAELEKDASAEEINLAFKDASETYLKGILAYNEDELVSSDFIGDSHSSIIDAHLTMSIGKRLCKVAAWYDNEWGFSARMCDVTKYIAGKM